MECVYFENDGQICLASTRMSSFEPDDTDIKNFCKNIDFQSCPRFEAMVKLKSANNILRVKKIK
jgi:hypothetical protein